MPGVAEHNFLDSRRFYLNLQKSCFLLSTIPNDWAWPPYSKRIIVDCVFLQNTTSYVLPPSYCPHLLVTDIEQSTSLLITNPWYRQRNPKSVQEIYLIPSYRHPCSFFSPVIVGEQVASFNCSCVSAKLLYKWASRTREGWRRKFCWYRGFGTNNDSSGMICSLSLMFTIHRLCLGRRQSWRKQVSTTSTIFGSSKGSLNLQ